MKISTVGFPRIGKSRELKFACEKYFTGGISQKILIDTAHQLRLEHWNMQKKNSIDFISSNDFSFYDNMLDTAVMLNLIPHRYLDLGLDMLDTYFAMARGYQGAKGDVRALSMKKWFNTNYHYIVPEIDDDACIHILSQKPFDEYKEAKTNGINTKPVIIGPFTFLKLASFTGSKTICDFAGQISQAYSEILNRFNVLGASWLQFDEPYLVMDLSEDDKELFKSVYKEILKSKKDIKVLLQTYFGDVRDCAEILYALDFDGIGLDFTDGKKSFDIIKNNCFPKTKYLFAGLVSGRNIWRSNYEKVLKQMDELSDYCSQIVLNTSCSLLHVPYTLDNETKLSAEYKKYLSFAHEKLCELRELSAIAGSDDPFKMPEYTANRLLFDSPRCTPVKEVWEKIRSFCSSDFVRYPAFEIREKIQKEELGLPVLPTTTIGSFPQTAEVRENRRRLRTGQINQEQYSSFNKEMIRKCISFQEEIGLDVLVHGEYERNDMVEYFSEQMDGFIFTCSGWVQSYGTRCVKPPIIWSDIKRLQPITVGWITYAQSLTKKPVKGMLTGPVTILNWSFPREDISPEECAFQIALAVREEVSDLEANGIKIIQIDEAALREKLPLRRSDWHTGYLDWAVKAFRLVHSSVKPQTQIHTHMCYSEFSDIISDIDDMDADVITFEASRSNLEILKVIKSCGFKTQTGPGVYDIHSPRVPGIIEIAAAVQKILAYIPKEKLWINPDCGLKTRGK